MTSLNVNDWVYSESPGVWRVYRVIQNVKRFKFSQSERQKLIKQPLIFTKRLVDSSWNVAFSNELATDTYVHPLSEDARQRLEEWAKNNPGVTKQFDAFHPAPIDLVVNLDLCLPILNEKEHVQRLIPDAFVGVEEGLTNDAILQRIAGTGLARYAPKSIRNAILQFVSKDHEIRDNDFLFREVRLLTF